MESSAPERPRRGPAPIASFDHDVSDESSPEAKQTFRLPEIREDPAFSGGPEGGGPEGGGPEGGGPEGGGPEGGGPEGGGPEGSERLWAGAGRARSQSTPAAPRIDISRASSSSHHDSRDSSPDLALFTGAAPGEDARLGFREDGALDLRSSTEELAFLEGPRKDSQGSEALLAVAGRSSRLSSVGSQCSAYSAVSGHSRVSRLSVVSGVSRSPSPHRMLLETSFCGPKPIETDPEVCAAAVEERLLEMAKMSGPSAAVDARDRREVRTEATVEAAPPAVVEAAPPAAVEAAPPATVEAAPPATTSPAPASGEALDADKCLKETRNRARVEGRRARPRVRREPSEPEVYKSGNRSKEIIRIRLKPEEDYEDDPEDSEIICASLRDSTTSSKTNGVMSGAGRSAAEESGVGGNRNVRAARPTVLVRAGSPARSPPAHSPLARSPPARSPPARSPPAPRPLEAGPPSPPTGQLVSRKSSFCSLFKSRETIASPDSPDALRRKRSLTEGRSRSKSRDRSATPTSTLSSGKLRGSVLSLFRGQKRGASSPSGAGSRDGSPGQPPRPLAPPTSNRARSGERLKYYEDSKDGIIHIPLRTPPNERPSSSSGQNTECSVAVVEAVVPREAAAARPSSAPVRACEPSPAQPPPQTSSARTPTQLIKRTVLPDGSIIIPLRSPTEKIVTDDFPVPLKGARESTPSASAVNSELNAITSPMDHEQVRDPPPEQVRDPPPEQVHDPSPEQVREPPPEQVRDPPPEQVREPPPALGAATPNPDSTQDEGLRRRKERLVFTTHVGSREQVFSTQFSITKTPSVTSEISGSFPSFVDVEEVRGPLRDTHIASEPAAAGEAGEAGEAGGEDSSGSEAGCEAAGARAGNEVERRGLVVQESFEDELPYVPTTLPLERSLALPMVPVRERAAPRVAGLERPRAPPLRPAPAPAPAPTPAPAPAPSAPDKLRIHLPRRTRTASLAPSSPAATPHIARPRTRSGGDGVETRTKPEWIDFEEVPERRKQPKRIQTLPAGASGAGAGGVVFTYVEPENCRCDCHARRTSPLASPDTPPHTAPADLNLHRHVHRKEYGSPAALMNPGPTRRPH